MFILRTARRAACLLFLFVLLAHAAPAATTASQVRGRVTGPDGKPMPAVVVVLVNDISGHRQEATTGADGTYLLYNVPPNPYHLTVDVQGFQPFHTDVDVRGGAAVVRDVALTFGVTATEAVHAKAEGVELESDTSMTHTDIDKSLIERTPAAMPGRAFESIVTSTPGFSADENGRYHFQGAHSQGEFVIDGQTISDQTGITFSNSIDPGIAQSMEVIYGNVPAEYGEKIGSVVNLATKSGLGTPFHGDVYGGAARYSTYEGGLSLGGGSRNFAAFASLNGSWSDRFLDPVNFDNLHNTGDTQRGFLRVDYASDDLR
ncbi:MAG TPA: carboxypeptidase regulatory-like domain-containing protein, partial [Thermoanaerobaculia bacterium]|nr:carboxypeptidase regulatory-like domain-containing protein [Thermoanaerobaculia bacterium]